MKFSWPLLGAPAERCVRITRLDREAAWQGCRARVEALEAQAAPNAWSSWDYFHDMWRLFLPGRRCHLIELPDPQAHPRAAQAPLAAAIWLEETSTRKRIPFRTLRTLDPMALRLPPFLMPRGREAEASRALVLALPTVARATGADLVSLYRLDRAATEPFEAALRAAGIPVRRRVFTTSPQLPLPDDLDAYLKTRGRSEIHDIQRRARKLQRTLGVAPAFRRFRGDVAGDPGFQAAWAAFERIRAGSWQAEWARTSGAVDPGRVTAFYRSAVAAWSRRGWLDLSLLDVGGEPAAGMLCLVIEGRVWGLLRAYDPRFREYGVGNLLFYEALVDGHRRGDRFLDFGGEALDWKRRWALQEDAVLELEWPTGTLKSQLWRLQQWLSPPAAAGAVRDAEPADPAAP